MLRPFSKAGLDETQYAIKKNVACCYLTTKQFIKALHIKSKMNQDNSVLQDD